jgi:hypothetical protein
VTGAGVTSGERERGERGACSLALSVCFKVALLPLPCVSSIKFDTRKTTTQHQHVSRKTPTKTPQKNHTKTTQKQNKKNILNKTKRNGTERNETLVAGRYLGSLSGRAVRTRSTSAAIQGGVRGGGKGGAPAESSAELEPASESLLPRGFFSEVRTVPPMRSNPCLSVGWLALV